MTETTSHQTALHGARRPGAAGRRLRTAARWLTALLLVGATAACASRGAADRATAGAATPPTTIGGVGGGGAFDADGRATIALLTPTGDARAPIRTLGQSIANAAQLAANDIGDPRLTLRVYDTQGTAAGAALAAERAIADGAALIVGPLFAESSRAVGPVAAGAGRAVISFSTDASVAGGNVFVIGFLPGEEIARVVSYASSQGVRRYAAVAPIGDYGDLTTRALARAAAAAGGAVVDQERYVRDFQGIESSSRSYAERHNARTEFDPVDGLLLADQGQALQSLAAFLEFHDVSPQEVRFLGVSGWNAQETLQETALRGGWFAAPDPRLREQFASRFETAYGAPPHPLASLGYDAVAAAGAMAADARARGERFPFTGQAISDPSGFAGVNGVYRFLRSGLNERSLAVLEVGEDGFRVIDPAPTSFAGL